ncbi:MAG TPA: glycosyl hydrolase, partial [Chloroflexota bacterium]
MTFYFGACAGGVWKTCDGGTYWENVSDGYFNTAAVGAIAVAPSDPNVVYAGTGETTIRGDVSHGDGVYRSSDGGKTWSHLGLSDSRHIAKIRVHPDNPDFVYVAVLGHAWGPNGERGLYRSKDGGVSWERILYRDEQTGAIDLSIDPKNPRILFAALWQAQRSPYSLSSGGPGSGIFRSTDGGDSWEELTYRPGLPSGVKGKIGLAVSAAGSGRIWALVEAEDGALFRSDDGGESWQRLNEDAELRKRAWYYTHVFADPRDADTVWVLNLQCWKSIDGGRTVVAIPTPHGDNHDLWIDPVNPLRMIEGNDGGACVTFNGGMSWST